MMTNDSDDSDILSCETTIYVKIFNGWVATTGHVQLPGGLFSPSDKCKKTVSQLLLRFPIGIGSYVHHAKYQGVFP